MNCLYEPMHKSHLSTAINYIILFFIYRQVQRYDLTPLSLYT